MSAINSNPNSTDSKRPIFPQKLWQIVNDCRLDSAIKWTDDGQSFIVFENQLKNLCLGKENKLFYTSQPKSFVRQLHLYGFRKINKNQFAHRFFQRDRPTLVKSIKRSYKAPNSLPDEQPVERRPAKQQLKPRQPQVQPQSNPQQQEHPAHPQPPLPQPPPLSSMSPPREAQPQPQQQLHIQLQAAQVQRSTSLDDEQSRQDETIMTNQSIMSRSYEEDACIVAPLAWYAAEAGGCCAEINYNFSINEESLLNLYNNDVYPNTCDTITL